MQWYERLDEKIRDYLPDMTVERDVPMSRHTSFRIGGPARRMAFPESREHLVILLGLAEGCGIRPFLLGRGTNLLVSDRGLDTLVIKTAERMTSIRRLDDVTLEADAGVLLSRLAVYAQQAGLAGLEFAHGIPGSLGGAVCMNAGAYGGEMRQVVTEVTALYPDGIRRFTGDQAEFAYRHSRFLEDGSVVLGAVVRLTPDDPAAIRQRMDDLMAQGLPAPGMAQRRQHLQAAGGLFCRDPHRPDGPEGPDGGRRPGVGKACGLRHQHRQRHLRRRAGADPPGAGGRIPGPRRPPGAGGPVRG